MEFDFEQVYDSGVSIKVVGVGGGGNNAVNRMISTNIRGVEFIAVNTDSMALDTSCAAKKLVIGDKITRGKGAGSNPEVGKRSAEESIENIKAALAGADMVFITAGMGGGTGTGAAPVIAKAAKELGMLTVGIVTKPFAFEGNRRYRQAEEGIKALQEHVDSLIVIPNERLKQVEDVHLTLANAFEIADDVLRRGVKSVSELINIPQFINLDFADVTAIMKDAGYAHMGVGSAKGDDKAQVSAMQAISSPLLETNITGATGVLISITASDDIELTEVDCAAQLIKDEADPDANIIWGVAFDPALQNEMRVTIIATGFDSNGKKVTKHTEEIYETPVKVEIVKEAPAPAPTAEAEPTEEPVAEAAPTTNLDELIKQIVDAEGEDKSEPRAVPTDFITPTKRTYVESEINAPAPKEEATPVSSYEANYGEFFKCITKKKN
ncbi:MAG: cell division protein FtsZ [Clostridia bacterium]|nr:cell division protein FtsZ [Clostridia bacterium]